MEEKRKPGDAYRTRATLLARKGAAEPLLRNEARLELVGDGPADASDDARLADAVVEAAAEALLRTRSRKPVASLTDLLDESLIGVVSPHSGQVGRTAPKSGDSDPEAGPR